MVSLVRESLLIPYHGIYMVSYSIRLFRRGPLETLSICISKVNNIVNKLNDDKSDSDRFDLRTSSTKGLKPTGPSLN